MGKIIVIIKQKGERRMREDLGKKAESLEAVHTHTHTHTCSFIGKLIKNVFKRRFTNIDL